MFARRQIACRYSLPAEWGLNVVATIVVDSGGGGDGVDGGVYVCVLLCIDLDHITMHLSDLAGSFHCHRIITLSFVRVSSPVSSFGRIRLSACIGR